MIFYHTGKTGSGKTQGAVTMLHQMWRDGKDVYSNTPLFFTKFNNGFGGENIKEHPKYFTIKEKLVEILRSILLSKAKRKAMGVKRRGKIIYFDTIDEIFHAKDAVIFFDEGQTLFRNYDWETIPKLFLYKMEQNRKHGLDLITTAQRPMAININYRYLVQQWSHFETILDIWKFHIYREKVKDVDYMDEKLQEKDIPNIKTKGLLNYKILKPWSKVFKLYDTFYDIGFEPLQHYSIKIGDETIKLHIESGMSVKQALSTIKTYGVFKSTITDREDNDKKY